jgi:dTDP-glucose 4,6-dehydratase
MKFDWANKRVLVTGSGGFIGSHLVEKLLQAGANVRGFVRYTSRNDKGFLNQLSQADLNRIEIITGDLRDPNAVQNAIRNCQIVFHLGALIAIPYSYKHPNEVVETNVIGTLNILNACREFGISRLIHTSTSEVYGTALRVPINEEHPLQGQSPYSASKIGADKLAESYFCAYNLPVVTVRPFNTFGPRQSMRAVIPTIITQALTSKKIKLGNLESTRDFTYITDTVNGFMLAAETDRIEGTTMNLGTGIEISIAELVQKISGLINQKLEIITEDQRLRPTRSEVMRLISNNTLAKKMLGWEPQVSLDQGLLQSIDWIKNHLELYDPSKYYV